MTPRLADLGEVLLLVLGYAAVAAVACLGLMLSGVVVYLLWYLLSGQYFREVKRKQQAKAPDPGVRLRPEDPVLFHLVDLHGKRGQDDPPRYGGYYPPGVGEDPPEQTSGPLGSGDKKLGTATRGQSKGP